MTTLRQVAKRVLPAQAVEWLRKRVEPTRTPTPAAVVRDPGPAEEYLIGLETMLWATGDGIYADKLARAIRPTSRGSRARFRGSMALARWHLSQSRPNEAVQLLEGVHSGDPTLQTELDLLRVDCFSALGQGQAALSLLSRMTRRGTKEQNLLLRVGRTRALLEPPMNHGSGPAIEALNSVYRATGFRMVRRDRVIDPVALENLACEVPPAEPRESLPLVTVVLPLGGHGAGEYSGVTSLLNQSWENLEVLAVGRAMQGSPAIDEGSMAADGRVVFVETDTDTDDVWSAALDSASGEFVTGHSFGAWAHPQRIATQASALLVDPSLRATMSSHMKVGPGLTPRPLRAAPLPRLVGPNPDSIMVRRIGLAPGEVTDVRNCVVDALSPVDGSLGLLPDVEVVAEDAPLTLTPYVGSAAMPG